MLRKNKNKFYKKFFSLFFFLTGIAVGSLEEARRLYSGNGGIKEEADEWKVRNGFFNCSVSLPDWTVEMFFVVVLDNVLPFFFSPLFSKVEKNKNKASIINTMGAFVRMKNKEKRRRALKCVIRWQNLYLTEQKFFFNAPLLNRAKWFGRISFVSFFFFFFFCLLLLLSSLAVRNLERRGALNCCCFVAVYFPLYFCLIYWTVTLSFFGNKNKKLLIKKKK